MSNGELEAGYAQMTGGYPIQRELCNYQRVPAAGGDYCVQQTCNLAPGLSTTKLVCHSGRAQGFISYPDQSGEFYERGVQGPTQTGVPWTPRAVAMPQWDDAHRPWRGFWRRPKRATPFWW